MRPMLPKAVEAARVTAGVLASDKSAGRNGAFRFPDGMFVIASDGEGWEHVSVSFSDRLPTWDEMCRAKEMFWQDHEVVVQYHPAKSSYVNVHNFCLHLWRPIASILPSPPAWMVGPVGMTPADAERLVAARSAGASGPASP